MADLKDVRLADVKFRDVMAFALYLELLRTAQAQDLRTVIDQPQQQMSDALRLANQLLKILGET
jgi:hypothetical protein